MSESDGSPNPRSVQLGIVGCGVMGRGIAQIAALAGAHVRLFDANAGAATQAQGILNDTFSMLVSRGKLTESVAANAKAALHVCQSIDELAPCDMVVEAIVEQLEAKRTLFSALEAIVAPDAILATNTSSLSVTAIAAGLQSPQRVAGFHFFNPVPLMKIVEVIGGLLTAPEVLDRLQALGTAWGHTAVRAKDTPGFIVNHAGRGFGTEGLRILSEGVVDVTTLDAILRDAAGFKLGPCELMDMTGLDVSHPVMESIYHQYYEEARFRPQGLTRQMLSAGLLGKKTGRGFYTYDAGGKKVPASVAVPTMPASAPPAALWLSWARPELAQRIAANGITLERGESPSPQAVCLVTPLGEDCTTCAVREGLDPRRTLAIDALFDNPAHHVVMTNPATDAAAVAAASAALGANGARISVIRDSAGMIAQRVVAHIVNIACEIAQQGIASPSDIDHAVVLGLGYPHGPLAWGDRIGPSTVLTVLQHLQEQSGDPRYRPSSWLARRAKLGLSLLQAEQ
ncbi:MAG: 3-hydroxyacyl-CoA dehydrogenase [Pseudomonadota bacterium]|nr:3-hydroxyacyl-CoA dehydrogenase [Pseudomonadota bacterium]